MQIFIPVHFFSGKPTTIHLKTYRCIWLDARHSLPTSHVVVKVGWGEGMWRREKQDWTEDIGLVPPHQSESNINMGAEYWIHWQLCTRADCGGACHGVLDLPMWRVRCRCSEPLSWLEMCIQYMLYHLYFLSSLKDSKKVYLMCFSLPA